MKQFYDLNFKGLNFKLVLLTALSVLLLCSFTLKPRAEVWNAYNDFNPTTQPVHNWSYLYHPGTSWQGFGSLSPMIPSPIYSNWWESPNTPYLWSPQVGLTSEWARICLSSCKLGDGGSRMPGLGVLQWTAPAGGYYRIQGSGYIYPQTETRLLCLTERQSEPILDVTATNTFDEKHFDKEILLNEGDRVAFLGEPIIGHGTYEMSVSYWTSIINNVSVVPPPWTPLIVENNSVTCLNRTYAFQNSLLPSSITSGGVNLISNPIRLDARVSGILQNWTSNNFEVVEQNPDRVLIRTTSTSTSLKATCDIQIEFDGFMLCDLTVESKSGGAVTLSALDIVVPFNQSVAKLFHHHPIKPITQQNWITDQMNNGLIPSGGMALPFVHHMWIGDEKRGLQWFAESDEKLSPPGYFLTVSPIKTMKLSLTGTKTVSASSPYRFTFGFMASPVKPMLAPHAIRWAFPGGGIGIWNHDYWGNPTAPENSWLATLKNMGVNCLNLWDAQPMGDPYITNPDLANLLNYANQYGIKVLSSCGIWTENNKPGFNANTWPAKPVMTWSDGQGPTQYLMCQKSPWKYWFLDRAEKAYSQLNVHGLYLDGPVLPQQCQNTAHGCGYYAGGNLKYTCPILAARALMKQIYLLSKTGGRNNLIIAHNSSSVVLPCMSFADVYLDGEHLNAYPEQNQPLNIDSYGIDHTNSTYTLEGFRAQMIGHQYGVPAFYLKYWRPGYEAEDARRASAYALVHGMMPLPLEHASSAWKVYDEFDVGNATWVPYWSSPKPISSTSELKISTYVKAGQGALSILANLTNAPITTTIQIDRSLLDLNESALAWNCLTGKILSINSNNAAVEVPAGGYIYVQVGYKNLDDINLVVNPLENADVSYSSSTHLDSSNDPEKAADGSLSTGWRSHLESWPTQHNPEPPTAWWRVNWSIPQTFNCVEVYLTTDTMRHPNEFVLEAWSSSLSKWLEIARVKKTDNALTYIVYLENPITTTSLRYRVLNNDVFLYGANRAGGLQELGCFYKTSSNWATISGIIKDRFGRAVPNAHIFAHVTDASGDIASFNNKHIVGTVSSNEGFYSIRFDANAFPNISALKVQANGISVDSQNPNQNYAQVPVNPIPGSAVTVDITLPGPTEAVLYLGGASPGPWLEQSMNIPGTDWQTANAMIDGKQCSQLMGLEILFRVMPTFAKGRFDRIYLDVEYFDDGINALQLVMPPIPETFTGAYYIPGPSMIRKENSQAWRTQTLVYENSFIADWWASSGQYASFSLKNYEDGIASQFDYVDSIASIRLRFSNIPTEGTPNISCVSGNPNEHISKSFAGNGLHMRFIPAWLGETLGAIVPNVYGSGKPGYKTVGRSKFGVDIDNNYFFGSGKDITLKIEYFDDASSSNGITVRMYGANGNTISNTIRKTGALVWKTAILEFKNAAAKDGFYGCADILMDDNGEDDIISSISMLEAFDVQTPSSINAAKNLPDLTKLTISGVAVTGIFTDGFYVSEIDRSSGIKIVSSETVQEGNIIEVIGYIILNNGEREIHATSISILQ